MIEDQSFWCLQYVWSWHKVLHIKQLNAGKPKHIKQNISHLCMYLQHNIIPLQCILDCKMDQNVHECKSEGDGTHLR